MFKLNNRGFTLIELLAVLLLLAIIAGIGSYSIIGVLNDSKENNYDLLIKNIKSAVEQYRIECKYGDDSKNCLEEITLGYLVRHGYLKGNSTDSDNSFILVNPKDNENINDCKIKYSYSDGKIVVEAVNADEDNSCPKSY